MTKTIAKSNAYLELSSITDVSHRKSGRKKEVHTSSMNTADFNTGNLFARRTFDVIENFSKIDKPYYTINYYTSKSFRIDTCDGNS